MELTQTAFGAWSGGRFMHYGEALSEEDLIKLIRFSHEKGIQSYVTADVYGAGRADELIGEALQVFDRDSYNLTGAIGHDFYEGKREGSKGYPRFTDSNLRSEKDYKSYIESATQKSLERLNADHFDLLLLHNPDLVGYTSEEVWEGLQDLKAKGLAKQIGIAPGPANGFTVDIIDCFQNFGELIDWAMLILNPLEPWPGNLVLGTAVEQNIKVLTRVVDYGGLFHGDVLPGHEFKEGDHRNYRPDGWVNTAYEKISPLKEIADSLDLTLLQFACQWNLAHPAVECVVPTLIQEIGDSVKSIKEKVIELANLPSENLLTKEQLETIATIGNNEGCMVLKGSSTRHAGNDPLPDQWPMSDKLLELAKLHEINPEW